MTLETLIWVVDWRWNRLPDTESFPVRITTNSPCGTASTVTRTSPLPMSFVEPLLTFSARDTGMRPTSPTVTDAGPLRPSTDSNKMAGRPECKQQELVYICSMSFHVSVVPVSL